jgi:2-amino-4-hydroxy-6-hydroxymethyldihydropteridine diphosphokinase
MADAYVGLGSNIDALRRLRQALVLLRERFASLRASSVYRSPPVGFSGPDFLNMVVTFDCALSPERLVETLHEIERRGGRRKERDGSRTLDLDLLLLGRSVDAARRLPRADVLRYAFVLAPLAELAAQLVHPVTGVTMLDAWNALRATRPPLERLGPIDSL